MKQWVELESTKAWRDERVRDGIETNGIKKLGLERADALSCTSLGVLPESM